MNIIDVLKSILLPEMKIEDVRIGLSITIFTFIYRDMIKKDCMIQNEYTPGHETELCKNTIDFIVAEMFQDVGDLKEAEAWINGEKWDNKEENTNSIYDLHKRIMKNDASAIDEIETLDDAKKILKMIVSNNITMTLM